jgi:hypothetical protein
VCVCVCVCVCACVCIALLGYVWHGDHRTLIVAQDQVRACTSAYLCVCVALLGYVLHGDHRTLIVAQDQVRACTSVYLCVCCVCVYVCAWLCWAVFGMATTVPLVVAQDQVRACTSVNVRVRGFVGLCVTCPLQPRAVKQGKEHVHAHVLLCVPVCYVPFLCTR